MNSQSSRVISPSVTGFVLAACAVVLLNTVISCVKDAYAPFKDFLRSIAGHDWTTQGLFDLIFFIVLGVTFGRLKIGGGMDAARLSTVLIWSVAIASFGLALWFTFF